MNRPKLNGSRTMRHATMAQRLEDALQGMEGGPCTFWACNGPSRPRFMITCSHCWAIRHVAVVLAALKKQQGLKKGARRADR